MTPEVRARKMAEDAAHGRARADTAGPATATPTAATATAAERPRPQAARPPALTDSPPVARRSCRASTSARPARSAAA